MGLITPQNTRENMKQSLVIRGCEANTNYKYSERSGIRIRLKAKVDKIKETQEEEKTEKKRWSEGE